MVASGSFRKIVKRGQKLMVKSLGAITSPALTPHAVFTSCKGGDGKILARGGGGVGGQMPPLLTLSKWSPDCPPARPSEECPDKS